MTYVIRFSTGPEPSTKIQPSMLPRRQRRSAPNSLSRGSVRVKRTLGVNCAKRSGLSCRRRCSHLVDTGLVLAASAVRASRPGPFRWWAMIRLCLTETRLLPPLGCFPKAGFVGRYQFAGPFGQRNNAIDAFHDLAAGGYGVLWFPLLFPRKSRSAPCQSWCSPDRGSRRRLCGYCRLWADSLGKCFLTVRSVSCPTPDVDRQCLRRRYLCHVKTLPRLFATVPPVRFSRRESPLSPGFLAGGSRLRLLVEPGTALKSE